MMAARAPLVAALAATLLAGCAAVPRDAPLVAQYQPTALGLGQDVPTVDQRWWTAFNDPQLDRLIDLALAANPTLDKALARIRLAQSQIETERADLLPQVTGLGATQWMRTSKNFAAGSSASASGDDAAAQGGSPSHWVGIVGASLSWNLDLFGRQRAAVTRARATADAVALDAAASRLAVSTSVAETYVGLAQAKRQIAVADGFVQTRQPCAGTGTDPRARPARQPSRRRDGEDLARPGPAGPGARGAAI